MPTALTITGLCLVGCVVLRRGDTRAFADQVKLQARILAGRVNDLLGSTSTDSRVFATVAPKRHRRLEPQSRQQTAT
jgi:hypothetical protein